MGDFVIKDGVLRKYTGQKSDVVVPEGIREIGEQAFAFTGRLVLTSILLPAGVRRIGDGAFSGCSALTELTLPKGLQSIGAHAFYGCTRLTAVEIPAGVQSIGPWAFCSCGRLEAIAVPEGVRSIGACTFWGCGSLTGADLPESVTEISRQAFCGCARLERVTMLGRLETVHQSAFEGCRPVLIAPNTPLSVFDKNDKPGAVLGFAKAYAARMEMVPDARQSSLQYIRQQRRRCYPAAVRHPELFRLMLEEKIIPQKDVELLLEECSRQNNPSAKAEILEYAHRNFRPADPAKKYRL